MNACEKHQVRISAWFDAELDRAEQFAVVDHMSTCAACREFYRDARALESAVSVARAGRSETDPSLPLGLWERIERDARPPRAVRPAWASLAAAAVVFAVLGLGFLSGAFRDSAEPGPAVETVSNETTSDMIELGGKEDRMDDERFVELTREVLSAGPRYRAAMYEIMRQVNEDTQALEASAEYDSLARPSGETFDASREGRNPV